MDARATLLSFVALSLVSCGDSSETGAPKKVDEPHGDPWDWSPADVPLALGRQIYLAECALCHNEGEEGAPALHRKAEWERRLAKGEDTLIAHALDGFIGEDGEMPARGGSDHLSDQEVINAVRYMLATPK